MIKVIDVRPWSDQGYTSFGGICEDPDGNKILAVQIICNKTKEKYHFRFYVGWIEDMERVEWVGRVVSDVVIEAIAQGRRNLKKDLLSHFNAIQGMIK